MTDDESEPVYGIDEAAHARQAERTGKRWTVGIAAGMIALCGLSVWGFSTWDSSRFDPVADAERVCVEDFVPKRLKAPATAQFSGVAVDYSSETYIVSGSVDSQNGFGALIRSKFVCTVTLDGEKWHLASVDFR